MDDSQLEGLEQEDEQTLGHLGSDKKVVKRNGRGFSWNSETGKYTPL